jgi:hypothetical protein
MGMGACRKGKSRLAAQRATAKPDYQSNHGYPNSARRAILKLQGVKRLTASAVMTAALSTAMFVTVPMCYADDHSKCQHAIERAESKVEEAVRKHGERSHEAEERRKDLNAERERCWSQYHGWWDGKEKRWHEDHDWH